MTATKLHPNDETTASDPTTDMKLEVVIIPVSNIGRAKEFYGSLGWRLDADVTDGDDRVVQFTPPGSQCSIQFGTNLAPVTPAFVEILFLIVADIQAGREELVRRGVDVSEVFHYRRGPAPFGGKVAGVAPERLSYGSYASFRDPDGNRWLLQEVTTRLPGRIDSSTTSFASATELANALRRAETAHSEHEKRIGKRDAEWPDWYAAYLAAEQSGAELPS